MSNDLDSLRTLVARATGTGWEAAYRQDVAALVAEVERLRAEAAKERAAERAAVVAWLHYAADTRYYDCCCGPVAACADAIERGEHRREGGE